MVKLTVRFDLDDLERQLDEAWRRSGLPKVDDPEEPRGVAVVSDTLLGMCRSLVSNYRTLAEERALDDDGIRSAARDEFGGVEARLRQVLGRRPSDLQTLDALVTELGDVFAQMVVDLVNHKAWTVLDADGEPKPTDPGVLGEVIAQLERLTEQEQSGQQAAAMLGITERLRSLAATGDGSVQVRVWFTDGGVSLVGPFDTDDAAEAWCNRDDVIDWSEVSDHKVEPFDPNSGDAINAPTPEPPEPAEPDWKALAYAIEGDRKPWRPAMEMVEEMRLSSASDRDTVRLLVALLTTCMDTDLADAIRVLQAQAPDSWEVMGYVMKASTQTYEHEDFPPLPVHPPVAYDMRKVTESVEAELRRQLSREGRTLPGGLAHALAVLGKGVSVGSGWRDHDEGEVEQAFIRLVGAVVAGLPSDARVRAQDVLAPNEVLLTMPEGCTGMIVGEGDAWWISHTTAGGGEPCPAHREPAKRVFVDARLLVDAAVMLEDPLAESPHSRDGLAKVLGDLSGLRRDRDGRVDAAGASGVPQAPVEDENVTLVHSQEVTGRFGTTACGLPMLGVECEVIPPDGGYPQGVTCETCRSVLTAHAGSDAWDRVRTEPAERPPLGFVRLPWPDDNSRAWASHLQDAHRTTALLGAWGNPTLVELAEIHRQEHRDRQDGAAANHLHPFGPHPLEGHFAERGAELLAEDCTGRVVSAGLNATEGDRYRTVHDDWCPHHPHGPITVDGVDWRFIGGRSFDAWVTDDYLAALGAPGMPYVVGQVTRCPGGWDASVWPIHDGDRLAGEHPAYLRHMRGADLVEALHDATPALRFHAERGDGTTPRKAPERDATTTESDRGRAEERATNDQEAGATPIPKERPDSERMSGEAPEPADADGWLFHERRAAMLRWSASEHDVRPTGNDPVLDGAVALVDRYGWYADPVLDEAEAVHMAATVLAAAGFGDQTAEEASVENDELAALLGEHLTEAQADEGVLIQLAERLRMAGVRLRRNPEATP